MLRACALGSAPRGIGWTAVVRVRAGGGLEPPPLVPVTIAATTAAAAAIPAASPR
jgi:hypothetical protein